MNLPILQRPAGWRGIWMHLHRWGGLLAAPFLIITGLTGAIISWDHEIDALLNPHLTRISDTGPAIPSLDLLKQVEIRHPEIRVTFVPLAADRGESLAFGVQPRLDSATGKLFRPGFNQVFINPITGEELGTRQWGAVWPISRETLVSFLYKLHYSLHLPEMAGTDRWGIWLLGGIAALWSIDCFIAVCLTLPANRRRKTPSAESFWQRWRPAWLIRRQAGTYKLNYDLHRAFGLWTWLLLFLIAFTAFSLNLRREVFLPALSAVTQVTPTPFEQRRPQARNQPIEPRIGFTEVIDRATQDAHRHSWPEPVGSVFYGQQFGIYSVQFFLPEADHGTAGAGHRRLYYDGRSGSYLGEKQPWTGSVADLFVQAQFPLHSGRLLGLGGRVLVSLMGLVVALLSITGIYLWWKKRRSRQGHSRLQA